jgi:protein AroM
MSGPRRRVGTITIGQSPRVDVVPELQTILGPTVEIVEGGALDTLTSEQIAAIAPRNGEDVLVTRLRDGSSVQIAEHQILPLMQAEVTRLEGEGVDVVALLCTGQFPRFRSAGLVVEPERLLGHFVAGVAHDRRLGVIVPAPEQVDAWARRWRPLVGDVRVEAGSPYADIRELERAATALRAWRPDLIVLDCMGFSGAMKARAAEIVGVPVVLPRNVLARTLAELL